MLLLLVPGLQKEVKPVQGQLLRGRGGLSTPKSLLILGRKDSGVVEESRG